MKRNGDTSFSRGEVHTLAHSLHSLDTESGRCISTSWTGRGPGKDTISSISGHDTGAVYSTRVEHDVQAQHVNTSVTCSQVQLAINLRRRAGRRVVHGGCMSNVRRHCGDGGRLTASTTSTTARVPTTCTTCLTCSGRVLSYLPHSVSLLRSREQRAVARSNQVLVTQTEGTTPTRHMREIDTGSTGGSTGSRTRSGTSWRARCTATTSRDRRQRRRRAYRRLSHVRGRDHRIGNVTSINGSNSRGTKRYTTAMTARRTTSTTTAATGRSTTSCSSAARLSRKPQGCENGLKVRRHQRGRKQRLQPSHRTQLALRQELQDMIAENDGVQLMHQRLDKIGNANHTITTSYEPQ
jgi:hypothetical protein